MSIYNGIYSKGASVPVNRHPSFHFRKLVFSFIHKSFHTERERERERERVLFVVHGDCSASSMCC